MDFARSIFRDTRVIHISSNFDSGAIEVVDATDPQNIRLRIRNDSTIHGPHEFLQWFHFRASGVRGVPCRYVIENAGAVTYPSGWQRGDYAVRASVNQQDWFTVTTKFENGALVFETTTLADSMWFAYFEPYSFERHLHMLARVQVRPGVTLERLGATVEGRDLDMLLLGNPQGKPVWIIARQHPGETMAQWFCEGMLEALTDTANPIAREVLRFARFHIVPNMNPDGSVRGNLRVNAAGANLNREWMQPSMERSPEVFLVRERMQQTGVALFVDAHGDEGLPYNFIAGSEMIPGFTPQQKAQQDRFLAVFKQASPDFQTAVGYPSGKYDQDMLKLASKWVGHTFGCISVTLEMPFKDNANAPMPQVGWNGARSKALGAAILQPILDALGEG
jgi:murein tripeptide amidase MpaA